MRRGKDEFLQRTGGFRILETDEEFEARVAEINQLESDIKTEKVGLADREKALRRLCQLKGIDFDAPDNEDN
jgi:hypothetical protein